MTYTMRCLGKGCGWRGEVKRAMGDVEGILCPKCKSAALPVVIAPVPRVWKGGKP